MAVRRRITPSGPDFWRVKLYSSFAMHAVDFPLPKGPLTPQISALLTTNCSATGPGGNQSNLSKGGGGIPIRVFISQCRHL